MTVDGLQLWALHHGILFLTHCQGGPPRGGEVSHGGAGMFCWMY